MESGIQHDFDHEDHFWQELDDTVAQRCNTHSLIDDALRSYLTLATRSPEYIQTDHDLRRCAYKLYTSPLFNEHADYIRRQFIHCLLQEEDACILRITTTFLLSDARENEHTFELLNNEGIFPRLVHLISAPKQDDEEGLHRQLMELLYEMARLQRITNDDLTHVNDDFICCLFEIIEQVSGNVDDPYHYPVIRVLLVLNEQFMVAAHDPTIVVHKTTPLTNKVMKVLSGQGSRYKIFGENIILLLNREDETSLQLLTLKLLYLLFTTPPTYEYFYTNDLHVLVDILIRNLLDLPEEAMALRHTYLRVLFPLLEHTQLKDPPHYKRDEVRRLLSVLAGGHRVREEILGSGVNYFEEVDDTTKRLVHRCQTVSWLKDAEIETIQPESPVDELSSPTKSEPPALPAPRKLRKRNLSKESNITAGSYLKPQLESARQSSLSMAEMAAQKEKPGVITPSRNPSIKHGLREAVMRKERPPPPKARRSGWPRSRQQRTSQEGLAVKVEEMIDAPQETSTEESESLSSSLVLTPSADQSKAPKKPPPAPKTRRWRGKHCRTADEDGDGTVPIRDPNHEPGKFTTDLPSISLPVPNISVSNHEPKSVDNPFSPPEQKTLSEASPFSPPSGKLAPALSSSSLDGALDSSTPKSKKRISSVSAALGQAQAQALHDIEQSLEKTTIHEEEDTSATVGSGDNDYQHLHLHQHPQHRYPRQAILAPPGQAPTRGVPGPKMELERSPFLSENEDSEGLSGGGEIVEGSELEQGLALPPPDHDSSLDHTASQATRNATDLTAQSSLSSSSSLLSSSSDEKQQQQQKTTSVITDDGVPAIPEHVNTKVTAGEREQNEEEESSEDEWN